MIISVICGKKKTNKRVIEKSWHYNIKPQIAQICTDYKNENLGESVKSVVKKTNKRQIEKSWHYNIKPQIAQICTDYKNENLGESVKSVVKKL